MRITELGTYELTEDSHIRFNSNSVGTCPKGMIFKVTQLDLMGFKFYSPEMGDWQHYYFPARKVFQPGDRVRELHRGRSTNATGTVVSYKNGTVTYKIDNPVGEFLFAHVDMDDLECLPNPQDHPGPSGPRVHPVVGPLSGSEQ